MPSCRAGRTVTSPSRGERSPCDRRSSRKTFVASADVSVIRRGRRGLELRSDGPHVHETKQQQSADRPGHRRGAAPHEKYVTKNNQVNCVTLMSSARHVPPRPPDRADAGKARRGAAFRRRRALRTQMGRLSRDRVSRSFGRVHPEPRLAAARSLFSGPARGTHGGAAGGRL